MKQEEMEKSLTQAYDTQFQQLVQEVGDAKKAKSKLYEELDQFSKIGFEFECDEQGNPIRVSKASSCDAWCE